MHHFNGNKMHHFNGNFPGKPGSVRCPIYSQSRVILILSKCPHGTDWNSSYSHGNLGCTAPRSPTLTSGPRAGFWSRSSYSTVYGCSYCRPTNINSTKSLKANYKA